MHQVSAASDLVFNESQRGNNIRLMYGLEGNSFVFPRVLMFPETKSTETSDSRENKTN